MTNSIGDRSVTRKEVFDSYLMYYSSVWSQGNGKVCNDTQVTERAKHVLIDADPAARFSVLAFYPTLSECVQYTARDCRNSLFRFIKVAEMLEKLCINLFLFPWKKEFKTLKKFTGQFVYNIQPVLPQETTKGILQRIGYCFENDTEYKLSDHVDLHMVKTMGFELFLARLECEHLLEVMGQRPHAECLEILNSRASPHSLGRSVDAIADQHTGEAPSERQEVEKGDGKCEETFVLNPGSSQDQDVLQSIRPSSLGAQDMQDTAGSAEVRPPQAFMSDDKSLLEMKENYPDLAFRLKPIFKNHQTDPKSKDWPKDPAMSLMHTVGTGTSAVSTDTSTVSTDMSGPQSIALHTESTTAHRKLQFPEPAIIPQSTEEKQPCVLRGGSSLQNSAFSQEDTAEVMELTEQLGQLQLKGFSADEPLKYPTEETARAQQGLCCRDYDAASSLCSPTKTNQAMPSGSSKEPTFSSSPPEPPQDDPIKEPPHSFYIPNCLSGCSPAVAPPTDNQGELQPTEQWPHCL